MLTVSLIIAIIGGAFFVERLRSIQKHSRSHLVFMTFQRKVMDLLRSENLDVSKADYKKLRKLLSVNDALLDVYSCQRPSLFHTRFLFFFLDNNFIKKAYEYDKMVTSLKPKDERVVELQADLNRLIEWTVFYNTPRYVLILSILILIPMIFALQTKIGFKQWYSEILKRYSKKEFNNKLGHLMLHN